MYKDTIEVVTNSAIGKLYLLKKNPIGYFMASILAGFFIGLGVILAYTVGGLLVNQPLMKILMGATFGIALSLVVICGAELFTGNNMVMGIAILEKKIKTKEAVKLWIVCLIGNWVGAIILSLMYSYSGLNTGATAAIFAASSLAKMSGSFSSLFIKAIFCNILVCLAVWSTYRLKNESAKLMMIWWCLFAFIIAGFEHSIANMSILTIGLFSPSNLALSLSGYFWNISIVILGNMVGGIIFVALPYYLVSKEK